MKGELIRGRRTNHVLVDHQVLGSAMMTCNKCVKGARVTVNHAILEGNLVMCGNCGEISVRTGPQRGPHPDVVLVDEHPIDCPCTDCGDTRSVYP